MGQSAWLQIAPRSSELAPAGAQSGPPELGRATRSSPPISRLWRHARIIADHGGHHPRRLASNRITGRFWIIRKSPMIPRRTSFRTTAHAILTLIVSVRATLPVTVIAALVSACGGKAARDFAAPGTKDPTGSAGAQLVDVSAGGAAGVIPGTGGKASTAGMVNTTGAVDAGPGGSAASSSNGGGSGIDWSLID